MLKRLRKTIALTVTLAVAVILGIFATVYAAVQIGKNNQSFVGGMRWETARGISSAVQDSIQPKSTDVIQYATVVVSDDGQVLSDNDSQGVPSAGSGTSLEELVKKALDSSDESGTFAEEGVAYLRIHSDGLWYITFADTAALESQNNSIILHCLALFIGGTVFFALAAMFLVRWATRPVRVAWENQQRFVADASHTLKTPLSIILANASLLRSSALTAQDRQRLDFISDEAQDLLLLVNGLLSLAETSSMESMENLEPVDLSSLAAESALHFESLSLERSIPLDTAIEDGIYVLVSPDKLSTLLYTLLDNAVKYVPDGGDIMLEVRRVHQEAVISVSNTYPPISSEQLSKLFDRFYQRERFTGHGIGLSIAKSITEYYGGKISAACEDGKIIFTVAFHMQKPVKAGETL